MPEITTERADLRALQGLHLWHAAISNCSQRVRLVLEEKGLDWSSHLINLFTFEHATPEYQSIHPKGLVPLLIHDGRTITDSNDIIIYLDRTFPEPPLAVGEAGDLLALADSCQLALRTVSHELLLGEVRRLDADTLARFGRDHRNREFYQFLHRFSTEGFHDDHLAARLAELGQALAILDERLARHPYLAGEHVSLADFSWVVNVHRLALIDYPLERFPCVSNWFAKMRDRRSFARALTAYEKGLPIPSPTLLARRARLFEGCTIEPGPGKTS